MKMVLFFFCWLTLLVHTLVNLDVTLSGTLYDQLLILNDKNEVDATQLQEQGLPYYASTWVISLLAWNLGMAATFTHLLLWNHEDLCHAWRWMDPAMIKDMWSNFNWRFWNNSDVHEMGEQPQGHIQEPDPHYQKMLAVCLSFPHLMIIEY